MFASHSYNPERGVFISVVPHVAPKCFTSIAPNPSAALRRAFIPPCPAYTGGPSRSSGRRTHWLEGETRCGGMGGPEGLAWGWQGQALRSLCTAGAPTLRHFTNTRPDHHGQKREIVEIRWPWMNEPFDEHKGDKANDEPAKHESLAD
jgi:hypothetical protein